MLHGNPAFLVFIGKVNLTEDLIVGGMKKQDCFMWFQWKIRDQIPLDHLDQGLFDNNWLWISDGEKRRNFINYLIYSDEWWWNIWCIKRTTNIYYWLKYWQILQPTLMFCRQRKLLVCGAWLGCLTFHQYMWSASLYLFIFLFGQGGGQKLFCLQYWQQVLHQGLKSVLQVPSCLKSAILLTNYCCMYRI